MTHEYHEIPGGTHGSVIATGGPDIFAFFAKHTKGHEARICRHLPPTINSFGSGSRTPVSGLPEQST